MGHRAGFSTILPTENLMKDLRYQPSLQECFHLGVAKAHRTVVYSHYEHRNVNRSSKTDTRKVT